MNDLLRKLFDLIVKSLSRGRKKPDRGEDGSDIGRGADRGGAGQNQPGFPALPKNPPTPPSMAGTRSEECDLLSKPDGTIRVRWPTSLAFPPVSITEKSVTEIYESSGGTVTCTFRSWDTDNGAKRASYTAPFRNLAFPVTCVLFRTKDNKKEAVAHFKAERFGSYRLT